MNQKLYIVIISLLVVFLIIPLSDASASHTVTHTIEELQAKILELQSQVRVLQAGLVSNAGLISNQGTAVSSGFVFTRPLYLGQIDATTNGEVTKLQQFLAQDKAVYPEGLVTGYFGPLTEQAVQRWQARQGVVSSGSPETTGYGVVGPRTRGVMNLAKGITTMPRYLTPPPAPIIPFIQKLTPFSGPVGTVVTITGSGFTPEGNRVNFDSGVIMDLRSADGRTLVFAVPADREPLCAFVIPRCLLPSPYNPVTPGTYKVSVTNVNGTSNAVAFTVTDSTLYPIPVAPFIQSFVPYSGLVGTSVTITGSGFTPTGNDIHFGSIGGIKNVSSKGTTLVFEVPSSVSGCDFWTSPFSCTLVEILVTPGRYEMFVINANGTSNKVIFTVTDSAPPAPIIPSIQKLTPFSGPIGTAVTITGSGFTPEGNRVNFDSGVIMDLRSADGRTLVFAVPADREPLCAFVIPRCLLPSPYNPVTPGTYKVSVTNVNGTSNAVAFTVTGSASVR